MNNDPSDYHRIRAYAEERLKPMLRLQRQRALLFFNVLMFLVVNALVYSQSDNPIFWNIQQRQFSDYNGVIQTYTTVTPYNSVIAASLIWFVLLIIHAFSVTVAFRHEGAIQRQMNKEAELEKLYLSIELARLGGTAEPLSQTSQRVSEKLKRTVSLTDDGELIANDELPDKPLRRNMNQREG